MGRCAAVITALLVAGCSTTWDPHAPKTVTASGEGGRVTVEHGQRLRLPLATDPGANYEWRLAEPPVRAVVAQGPGDEYGLTFTPVRSGVEQLRLEYRPVSGEGAPQRTVSYDVAVPETGLRAWLRSLLGRRLYR